MTVNEVADEKDGDFNTVNASSLEIRRGDEVS